MKIYLDKLKEGVLSEIEYRVDPKEFDMEFVDLRYCDTLRVKGTLEKGHDTLIFRGRMASTIEQTCGRCLITVGRQMNRPFDLCYEIKGKEFIDPMDDLREILLLDHPIRFICREDCKGLCPNCGVNLNETSCACRETPDRRPLSRLGDIIDQGGESCRGQS